VRELLPARAFKTGQVAAGLGIVGQHAREVRPDGRLFCEVLQVRL
jgi:hypothetical protein